MEPVDTLISQLTRSGDGISEKTGEYETKFHERYKYVTGEDMLNTFISGFWDVMHRRFPVQGCRKLSSGDQGDKNKVYECGYYFRIIAVAGAASMCWTVYGIKYRP